MSSNLSRLKVALMAQAAGVRGVKLTPALVRKQAMARVQGVAGQSCAECWGEEVWEDQLVAMGHYLKTNHCLYGRMCDCGCGSFKWGPLRRHSDPLPAEEGLTITITGPILFTPPP